MNALKRIAVFIIYWIITAGIFVACMYYFHKRPKVCLMVGAINIIQCLAIYLINKAGMETEELEQNRW